MDFDNQKKEINDLYKILKDRIENCEVNSSDRKLARERLAEFDFVIKHKDMIDFKEFETNNLQFPLQHYSIFEKHFEILRRYCHSNHISKPKIILCKCKFDHWKIYFKSTKDHIPVMFYVLIDNLCSELEQSHKFKK